jgi:hypothetical protein
MRLRFGNISSKVGRWVKGVIGGRLVLARRKASVGSWADSGEGWSGRGCGELLSSLLMLVLAFGVALAFDGRRGVEGVCVRGVCAGKSWSRCKSCCEDIELVGVS